MLFSLSAWWSFFSLFLKLGVLLCLFLLIQGQNMRFFVFKGTRDVSQNLHVSDFLKLLAFLIGFKQHSWEMWPSLVSLSGSPTPLLREISQESLGHSLRVTSSLWKAAIKPIWTCTSTCRSSLGSPPWKEAESSTFTGAFIHQEMRTVKERQSTFPRC